MDRVSSSAAQPASQTSKPSSNPSGGASGSAAQPATLLEHLVSGKKPKLSWADVVDDAEDDKRVVEVFVDSGVQMGRNPESDDDRRLRKRAAAVASIKHSIDYLMYDAREPGGVLSAGPDFTNPWCKRQWESSVQSWRSSLRSANRVHTIHLAPMSNTIPSGGPSGSAAQPANLSDHLMPGNKPKVLWADVLDDTEDDEPVVEDGGVSWAKMGRKPESDDDRRQRKRAAAVAFIKHTSEYSMYVAREPVGAFSAGPDFTNPRCKRKWESSVQSWRKNLRNANRVYLIHLASSLNLASTPIFLAEDILLLSYTCVGIHSYKYCLFPSGLSA